MWSYKTSKNKGLSKYQLDGEMRGGGRGWSKCLIPVREEMSKMSAEILKKSYLKKICDFNLERGKLEKGILFKPRKGKHVMIF